jgi:uncharacterized protein (TIRG00374 family)
MIWFKRALAIILLGVALYLFWPVAQELRRPEARAAFQHAAWGWLGAAVLIQAASYASLTGLNCLLLRPFEGKITFWRMLSILPAMAFIAVAIPSAGASGMVLRARFLGRQGYSAAAAAFTLVLESIYLAAALAVASLAGIGFLIQSRHLRAAQLAALASLAVIVVLAGGLLYVVGRKREPAKSWLLRGLALWNRLAIKLHRPAVDPAHVAARTDDFYDSLVHLEQMPPWPFLFTAFGRIGLDVATLGACFLAFRTAVTPGVLLTGYGLTLVLSALSALPGGLGLADISLAGIYAQLGAPGAALTSAAAALAYRLIAFWLLRLVGFVSWQILEAKR